MYFTEKQLRIMKFIQQFRSERGISPTMEEIAQKLGVTKITIYDHLNQLERKGALRRERFRARSIEPLVWVGEKGGQFNYPIVGDLASSGPIDGGGPDDTLDLSTMLPLNKRFFALRVRGNSLMEDQIRNGDYVIIEQRANPGNGETVLAVLPDGSATLRRFFREKTRIRLQAPGKGRKPIYFRPRELEIRGVVVGLLRNFNQPSRN